MISLENTLSSQPSKKSPEEFNLVILGGGTGSTVAAWTFAAEGKSVIVVRSQIYWRLVPEHTCEVRGMMFVWRIRARNSQIGLRIVGASKVEVHWAPTSIESG